VIGNKKFHCKNVFSFGRLNCYYKSTYHQVVIEDFVKVYDYLFIHAIKRVIELPLRDYFRILVNLEFLYGICDLL